jgi:hypothetical protein
MQRLNNDRGNPPRESYGILKMLDPDYADLIALENEFERKVERACRDGRFYYQQNPTLQ